MPESTNLGGGIVAATLFGRLPDVAVGAAGAPALRGLDGLVIGGFTAQAAVNIAIANAA
ncbi:hypothetical protein QN379_00840 [Glaciimonas sp. Gout2]|uniref:hypothetical protein n=1 Tax=unclassified Glaciimonas TaxID=2644401 RepID=UPI002AB41122|nr:MULTISPECIES: hypothetical protein [unclassified Glaciimonas]MDY7546780.1 hypothetical protein [Glaciimonas sp. CA11.2]MEB0011881.1 hypothetical protein [Glaciimonas sp. Cout2]MEB0080563.1 hypothetical protein [Glaciimonas sp. Gout2]